MRRVIIELEKDLVENDVQSEQEVVTDDTHTEYGEFHGWFTVGEVIHSDGGAVGIRNFVVALVELTDGTVRQFYPEAIKFVIGNGND